MERRLTKKQIRTSMQLSKPTFLARVKVLSGDKDSPFTYDQFKTIGSILPIVWTEFILSNL